MAYRHRVYREDGSFWTSEFRDDATRTVLAYTEAGTVLSSRPYTSAEVAAADAAVLADTAVNNGDVLRGKASSALAANATFIAIASPSTAQNAAQVKALTRQINALIRLEINALDVVTGT